MKEIYEKYYVHFSKLNSADLRTYNSMAKMYHNIYGDQLLHHNTSFKFHNLPIIWHGNEEGVCS